MESSGPNSGGQSAPEKKKPWVTSDESCGFVISLCNTNFCRNLWTQPAWFVVSIPGCERRIAFLSSTFLGFGQLLRRKERGFSELRKCWKFWDGIKSAEKNIFIRLCSIIYCIILYRIHYSIFKICLNDRICIRKDDANDLIVVLNLKIPGHIIHQIIWWGCSGCYCDV